MIYVTQRVDAAFDKGVVDVYNAGFFGVSDGVVHFGIPSIPCMCGYRLPLFRSC